MQNGSTFPEDQTYPSNDSQPSAASPADAKRSRVALVVIGIFLLILIGLAVLAVVYLSGESAPTEKIRDIFIIFMALEFLVIGLALIILIVQLASLINLLQNEVKPILDSTSEAARTLRGTAIFLSDNLADPIIKLSGYVAAMQKMAVLFGGFGRKK